MADEGDSLGGRLGRYAKVGTSMGGLIGLLYAATPGNAIRRLVLNDVGPQLDPAGLARISGYVGADPSFESFEAGEAALRVLMKDFGPHTDAQFRLLSRHSVVPRADGRGWGLAYDPAIAVPIREAARLGAAAPDLWPLWDAVRVPCLVLRGAQSDLLPASVAKTMTERGPRAQLLEFEGVGHAPTLIDAAQIEALERFVSEG